MSRSNHLCSVCNSPYRIFMEGLIIKGESIPNIMRMMQEKHGIKFNSRALYGHKKKHMDDDGGITTAAEALTVAMEIRSIDEAYKKGTLQVVDKVGTLNMFLNKVTGFISMLETAPAHQMAHKSIQAYIAEGRQLVHEIASLQGDLSNNARDVNVNVINMEVGVVTKAMAAVVREMFPGSEIEFARKVRERLAEFEIGVIDSKSLPMANAEDIDGKCN